MKYLWLLFFIVCACAPKTGLHQTADIPALWAQLTPPVSHSEQVLAHFSLHIQGEQQTGRMVGQLWGYPSSVMRLDLTASSGGLVAVIRESDNVWTAYLPSENKAYHDYEAQKGWSYFHIPVPFNVRQVSNLFIGNLGEILYNEYSKASTIAHQWTRLEFALGDVAFLEMSPTLDVLVFKGRSGWVLTCENPYSLEEFTGKQLYAKYTFVSVAGEKAILRLKSLELGSNWDVADLDLHLPDNVQWMRILHQ